MPKISLGSSAQGNCLAPMNCLQKSFKLNNFGILLFLTSARLALVFIDNLHMPDAYIIQQENKNLA